MRNIKKGFTVIELLVVLSISMITSSISYISFQGYSSDARNTKRTSDIYTLNSALEIGRVKSAVSLLQYVSQSSSQLAHMPSIAGYTAIAGKDYKAGIPNFILFGLDASMIKDPNGGDYSFGVTTKKDGQYQFAATMEGQTKAYPNYAFVKGTYQKREEINIDGKVNKASPNIFEIIKDANLGRMYVGDKWSGKVITQISNDLRSIIFDSPFTPGIHTVKGFTESSGLIGNYGPIGGTGTLGTGNLVVIDKGNIALPY